MRNTIIISILLFIAVVAASVFYFGNLDSQEKKSIKPINYLPSDTYLITSFVNDATTDNIFKDFEIFEAILGHTFQEQISELKQQILRNKELSNFLTGQEMFVSFHPEEDDLSTLFSIPSSNKLEKSTIQELFSKMKSNFVITKLDTLGTQLYAINKEKSDSTFYACYLDDIFFSSFSKNLLVKILDEKSPKLTKQQTEYFYKNNKRNAPFTVYLNHQNLPEIVKHINRNKPGDFLKQFINFKGHSVWNINYKQDALMLSGESILEDGEKHYLNLFTNQDKTTQKLYNFFPSNSAIYIEYSFSNKSQWQKDLKHWHQISSESENLKSQSVEIEKDHSGLLEDIENCLGNDFAVVQQNNGEYIGFVSISDSSKWNKNINKFAEKIADSTYRFRYSNLLYRFFGEGLNAFNRPYFLVLDNLIVIANNQSTLTQYIQKWKRKDFLTGTLGFKNYEKIQGNEANVTVFINTKNASNFLINNLKQKYSRNFRDRKDHNFQDFFSWSLQLTGNSGNFISRVHAIYKSKNTLGTTPEWQYSMKSRLINGPYVFNHSDTSQFILAQEQNHTVHAVHPSGTKMWSILFSGRIVGEVIQLKDRSILAVTDRRRLYRIDSNGQILQGFSTSIPYEPTSNPTFVNWNDLPMILIPSKNQIMAYDMQGGPISGWDNITLEGDILGPIQFHENKAIVTTSFGRIYFIDMNGNKTAEIDAPGDVSFVSNAGIVVNENKTSYYSADENGNVYQSFENGEVKNVLKGNWNKGFKVNFANISGTSVPELIVSDGAELQVYALNDSISMLYNYTFTQNKQSEPYFFSSTTGGLKNMGIAALGTNLIYVFAENGTIIDGFPVEAQSLFYYGRINYNSSNYLISTKRDFKLYAYRH